MDQLKGDNSCLVLAHSDRRSSRSLVRIRSLTTRRITDFVLVKLVAPTPTGTGVEAKIGFRVKPFF